VATKPTENRSERDDIERLEKALAECREQLARAESMLRAKQDNDPLKA
jgi:hypothetical protein